MSQIPMGMMVIKTRRGITRMGMMRVRMREMMMVRTMARMMARTMVRMRGTMREMTRVAMPTSNKRFDSMEQAMRAKALVR